MLNLSKAKPVLLIASFAFLVFLMAGCQINMPTSGPSNATVDDPNPTPSAEQTANQDAVQTESQPKTVKDVQAEGASEADEQTVADSDMHPAEQLIATFTEPSQTNGELLVLYGQVLDVNENPQANAVIEIWQTDATGVYDHPQDPGTGTRDTTFQFYGKATTNADGWYAFRTIVPGRYEPRPRHIHYKVKQDNNTLLTSQFYFSDDIAEVEGEGMFRAVGESGDLLLVQLVQGMGELLANGQIVIDTGIGTGTLPLTPSQAEGPYYPVVGLAQYDNDLARLP